MSSFTETILSWYDANARDLPWRRTHDPYAIWLSEIILQQTRIAQGRAYWERFMAAFPRVEALATASEDEVLRLWQGLGYYSRARNLHAAAKQIVALGHFPDTLEGIRALKGVGDYTAAAIGSIAFGLPVAVVDGNVYRVLARHFGVETPVGSTAARKEFTALAQSLLPPGRPGDFNQGMMDFGAVQCTPASPACLLCPLAAGCAALASGATDRLPVMQKALAVQTRRFDYIYLRWRGRTAIRKRGPGDIWQGLYEPIVFDRGTPPPDPPGRLAPTVPETGSGTGPVCAREPQAQLLKAGVKHQLTHRTLLVDFYLWEPATEPALPEGYIWIEEPELDRYAKPRLFELLIAALTNPA